LGFWLCKGAAQLCDPQFLFLHGVLAPGDIDIQCRNFHFFLGYQPDIGVHLGNDLFQEITGASQLELDRNRVFYHGLHRFCRAVNVADNVLAEEHASDK